MRLPNTFRTWIYDRDLQVSQTLHAAQDIPPFLPISGVLGVCGLCFALVGASEIWKSTNRPS